MKITEYLSEKQILLNVTAADKDALLRFIADSYVQTTVVRDREGIYLGLKNREETMSTGVGNGIGIPHTTNREITEASILLIRLARPIDFQSIDDFPVDIIIALIIPEKNTTLHLRLLARISRLCRNKIFIDRIRKAADCKELLIDIGRLEEKILIHS